MRRVRIWYNPSITGFLGVGRLVSAAANSSHTRPVMFIPYALLNPFVEELIVRAYLMTEIFDLTRSGSLAVIVSVLVQSSYHLYYGWAGAISVAFLFVVFSLYYISSRRALPVIVAHGVFDLIALIRL